MTAPGEAARAGAAALPLAGITVVALEQAVAAPFATRQLADLGARVIKVERPGTGDFARGYDRTVLGQASYFVWLNRGKESVELDVKSDAGRAALAALLARADVFVQNLAPGAAGRLGLGAADLRARYPRLICCSVSGYGPDGPYQDKKAYDLLIQCETGLLSVTGTPEEPCKAGISVADIAAGMYAYSGVLTALYERERTGHGCQLRRGPARRPRRVDEPAGLLLRLRRAAGPADRRPARRRSPRTGPTPPAAARCSWACRTTASGPCSASGCWAGPTWSATGGSAPTPTGSAHDAELTCIIETALAALTPDEVAARLDEAGIANARLRTPAEFAEHPQLAARDRWREVGTPGGPVRALLPPVTVPGRRGRDGRRARAGPAHRRRPGRAARRPRPGRRLTAAGQFHDPGPKPMEYVVFSPGS